MSGSDETLTPLPIIVIQNDEERPQEPRMVASYHLVDPGETIVREDSRQRGHGLDEGVCPWLIS